ncbi:MAG: hypothetical protein ACSLE1_02745 [Sphingobium sp.]
MGCDVGVGRWEAGNIAIADIFKRKFTANSTRRDPTPICAIMAKVLDVPAVSQLVSALDRTLKTARKSADEKAIPAYWFPKGHIVELATTGTAKSPGIRIVVGYRK